MVKRCQWGLCDSDSRYPERLAGEVKFIPFPKPKSKLEKCLRWIKAYGRPHDQLNTNKINGNYHMFVCTKHFPNGGPSANFPDPTPADSCAVQQATPARRPPKRRHELEPVPKRRRIFAQIDISNPINDENHPPTTTYENENLNAHPKPSSTETAASPLEMLALVFENEQQKGMCEKLLQEKKALEQRLAEQILQNVDLKRECAALKDKPKEDKKRHEFIFTVEKVRDCPIRDNFKYYTGFVYVQFMTIFNFLVPNKLECPFNWKRRVSTVKKT